MNRAILEEKLIDKQYLSRMVKVSFLNRYTSYILPILLLASDYVSVLLSEKIIR